MVIVISFLIRSERAMLLIPLRSPCMHVASLRSVNWCLFYRRPSKNGFIRFDHNLLFIIRRWNRSDFCFWIWRCKQKDQKFSILKRSRLIGFDSRKLQAGIALKLWLVTTRLLISLLPWKIPTPALLRKYCAKLAFLPLFPSAMESHILCCIKGGAAIYHSTHQ